MRYFRYSLDMSTKLATHQNLRSKVHANF